jgi:hypothetical protein
MAGELAGYREAPAFIHGHQQARRDRVVAGLGVCGFTVIGGRGLDAAV